MMLTWDCTAQYSYPGPERVWTLTPTVSETITLSAAGLTADLDLFVSEGSCEGGCLALSIHAASSDETVSFPAQAGQTYTVVLDGYNGAVSDFSLTADCTPDFLLQVDPPSRGSSVDLVVRGAPPGATVAIGVSSGPAGSGPCPPVLGGLCMDLVQPRRVATVVADALGRATISQWIPPTAPSGTYTLQAGWAEAHRTSQHR